MELRFRAVRKFDISGPVEVRDDFIHFAHTYIGIHRDFFRRHGHAEANNDPVNYFWDRFAMGHGGDGTRLSFPFGNAFVS